jgi:hypothetical protein
VTTFPRPSQGCHPRMRGFDSRSTHFTPAVIGILIYPRLNSSLESFYSTFYIAMPPSSPMNIITGSPGSQQPTPEGDVWLGSQTGRCTPHPAFCSTRALFEVSLHVGHSIW